MRTLLLVCTCFVAFTSAAQEKHKTKRGKSPYSYSYKLTREEYENRIDYTIATTEVGNNYIKIVGTRGKASLDTSAIKGTVTVKSGKEEFTIASNGDFECLVPRSTWDNYAADIYLSFEGYDELYVSPKPSDIQTVLEETLEEDLIFDPESPYMQVHSKRELSETELKALLDCLSRSRISGEKCYSQEEIAILIPI